MLKKILNAILQFFASIFGSGSKKGEKAATHQPNPPVLVEDSCDVPEPVILTTDLSEFYPAALFDLVEAPGNPTATPQAEVALPQEQPATRPQTEPAPPAAAPAQAEPLEATQSNNRFCWCLDNGHGKLQAGKRSPLFDDGQTRFFEYEFNRDIVQRIKKELDAQGMRYFDVVPDVDAVGSFLEGRVERANNHASNLPKIYVSIHANAGPAQSPNHWAADNIQGVETWFNEGSEKGKKIAAVFQKHLVKHTGLKNRNLKSTAEKPLYVLNKTSMPAILTESGFYNNKAEAKKLMQPDFRQKIADAHIAAILEIEANGLS
jgi:N-acetylmuramoyl-L-alanine amidase